MLEELVASHIRNIEALREHAEQFTVELKESVLHTVQQMQTTLVSITQHKAFVEVLRQEMNSVFSETMDDLNTRMTDLIKYINERHATLLEDMKNQHVSNLQTLDKYQVNLGDIVQVVETHMHKGQELLNITHMDKGEEDFLASCRKFTEEKIPGIPRIPTPDLYAFQPNLGECMRFYHFQAPFRTSVRIPTKDIRSLSSDCRHNFGHFFQHGLYWYLALRKCSGHLGVFVVLNGWEELRPLVTIRCNMTLRVQRTNHPEGKTTKQEQALGKYQVANTQSPVLATNTLQHTWTKNGVFIALAFVFILYLR
eukprot:TRINITY_DN67731_c3_g1_i3.p1 TRINITY_DN67731_c3_g1~~TRINITY_DN67731_c3_g1_i3.p1  ORF type:complete len:310 (-),score=31.86 TRINITY_DN67731_c3_g1_i3:896-1825(-)